MVDLGLGKIDFWSILTSTLIICFALWTRLFLHYGSQYLMLKWIDIPVTGVTWEWYRLNIAYHYWNARQEMLAVMAGPIGVTLFFILLIIITWLSNRYIGSFPKFFSKLIVWWGLSAIGDPFLVAVIDISLRISKGDIYKLYNYYDETDGAGFAGIVIILIIYTFIFMLNLLIFYNYVIFHHNDGRLQDIYVRQFSGKGFFIPDDNEISLKHLLYAYNSAIYSDFRILVNKFSIVDKKRVERWISTLQISKYDKDLKTNPKGTYIKDDIGRIKEINEDEISKESAIHYDRLDRYFDGVETAKGQLFQMQRDKYIKRDVNPNEEHDQNFADILQKEDAFTPRSKNRSSFGKSSHGGTMKHPSRRSSWKRTKASLFGNRAKQKSSGKLN